MYGKLLLLAFAFAATAQAQPAPFTLTCKGTASEYRLSPYPNEERPISMGIIVNLTDRTVRGFEWPFDDDPLEIGYVNDVEVRFFGRYKGVVETIISGTINRVTGDVDATSSFVDQKPGSPEPHITYTLQCKPTQRMF
jgi:hypothetical protein